MSADDSGDEIRKSSGVGRRSFMVMMGSLLLGRFALPNLAGAESANDFEVVDTTDASRADSGAAQLNEQVRRVFGLPSWNDGHTFLLWVEETDDEEMVPMMWVVDTPEEKAEAERFYKAATWRSWRTVEELKELLKADGPWLVRWNFGGRLRFVNSSDRKLLFETDGYAELTSEPSNAATMSSGDALEIILRMTEMVEGLGAGTAIYYEPVRPIDALKDFRAAQNST